MRNPTLVLTVFLCQVFGTVQISRLRAADDTVFFVVRHADKLNETDEDPPLSEAGKKRAQQLMQTLRNLRIDAIYRTKWLRSKQTAEPLASKLDITTVE